MRLLYNATIHTMDEKQPDASALLISNGRVLALGGAELREQFPRAEKKDMGGRIILPGLVDAHLHIQYYALGLQEIDCETKTKQECLNRVVERAAKTPTGKWILGHGWQQNDWGGEFPTAADLDTIAPNHPVYLTAKSLHAAWANTAALKLAGINVNTPDPLNGKIVRDANGIPNGILLEEAMHLMTDALPHNNINEIADAIEKAQSILWEMGLTGFHDFDQRTSFMALQQLHNEKKLKMRVTKSVPVDLLPHVLGLGLRSGFGDETLRIGSLKVFMDGALGPRTAAMFNDYEGEPNNKGILNMDGEALFEIAKQAADVHLSMTVHAIGDRANHEVLNAYENLRAYEKEKNYPALRHRLEHVQVIHPDDAPRLGKLNVIASMQPIHAPSDMHSADKYWGARSNLAYAWRTQINNGAVLAFGSDAPVESPNPFWGIHAAVTRYRFDEKRAWYPHEKLNIQEAVAGFTTGAAYATHLEDRLGKLAPNYLADLIVLDKDPFSCDPDALWTMKPSATMVGGEWVYGD